MKLVKFRVEFTNHLGKVINLNKHIVANEGVSIIKEINKGYLSLDFTAMNVYFDPKLVGDDTERIRAQWQIGDGEIQVERFCIEAMEYIDNEKIKVYCKSKTFRFEKYYLYRAFIAYDLHNILRNLLGTDNVDLTKLTNYRVQGSVEIENKCAFDVVEELRNIFCFEYYYKQGKIVFEDKKAIQKEDESIANFDETKDIEAIAINSDIFKKRVGTIIINPKKFESVEYINRAKEVGANIDWLEIEPKLTLEVHPSPQPCSPKTKQTIDLPDGSTYEIQPKSAKFTIYTSTFDEEISCNLPIEFAGEIELTETFSLNNERIVELKSGVKRIVSSTIPIDDDMIFGNRILFPEPLIGEVAIKYVTHIRSGIIEPSEEPKTILIQASFKDKKINYLHKIECTDYYRKIPAKLDLNIIKDFGMSNVQQDIQLYKKDSSGEYNFISSITPNQNGDFQLPINEYGSYMVKIGDEKFYIDYYTNAFKIDKNSIDCQTLSDIAQQGDQVGGEDEQDIK